MKQINIYTSQELTPLKRFIGYFLEGENSVVDRIFRFKYLSSFGLAHGAEFYELLEKNDEPIKGMFEALKIHQQSRLEAQIDELAKYKEMIVAIEKQIQETKLAQRIIDNSESLKDAIDMLIPLAEKREESK